MLRRLLLRLQGQLFSVLTSKNYQQPLLQAKTLLKKLQNV
jgi:hypothetical protein